MNFINWLKGKKSYILAGLAIVYAVSGYFTGHLSSQEALGYLWSGGSLAAVRAAIAKLGIGAQPNG